MTHSLIPAAFAGAVLLLVSSYAMTGSPVATDQAGASPRAGQDGRAPAVGEPTPTAHPPLPASEEQFWLRPDPGDGTVGADATRSGLARGASLIVDGDFAAGLPLVAAAAGHDALGGYARYYQGVALAGLGRLAEAEALLTPLQARTSQGYLRQAVAEQLALVFLMQGEAARAVDLLESISHPDAIDRERVLLRLGEAAEAAGDVKRALEAYRTVYYDYPLGQDAAQAQEGIERLETPALLPPDRFARQLARAERLFAARRWAQARAGFEPLARAATRADDRELIALRIAEADYYLDRHKAARDALEPYLDKGPRTAEARFFHLTATRALGQTASYLTLARQLVDDFPDSSWAEETLNNLASHYIIEDDDAAADTVFRELARRFPKSRYAERAAWRIGWWSYKAGRFAEAAETFEAASVAFPRADYRPAWLYWSGRARDRADDRATANNRYRLTVTDYGNSYYGRLASKLLAERREPVVTGSVATPGEPVDGGRVPTAALIRSLIGAGLHEEALKEVRYAQQAWGDSPSLQATAAWLRHEQGLEQQAMERFLNIRGAITLMKRAYPQYLTAGGGNLPPEILRIMFPLDYWSQIQKYAAQYRLDPYLMASLVAQESTFTANIRSGADAYGLMQLLPSAGRQYARKVGLRYSLPLLSDPDANLRMGMAYFRELLDRFGGAHLALAGYNAGPRRVVRWIEERPSLATDEFIDDIPFPETQNYVKRILGQAEDYRRLYGGGLLTPRR